MIDRDLADAYKLTFAQFKTMIERGYDPGLESDWDRFRLGLPPFTEPDWGSGQ